MDERKPHLTAPAKVARRKLSVRNVPVGSPQLDVTEFLAVHPVTVAKWMAAYRFGGFVAPSAEPVDYSAERSGTEPFLTQASVQSNLW
jgi:hypothetical protein